MKIALSEKQTKENLFITITKMKGEKKKDHD
jgi:hypothetical protein